MIPTLRETEAGTAVQGQSMVKLLSQPPIPASKTVNSCFVMDSFSQPLALL